MTSSLNFLPKLFLLLLLLLLIKPVHVQPPPPRGGGNGQQPNPTTPMPRPIPRPAARPAALPQLPWVLGGPPPLQFRYPQQAVGVRPGTAFRPPSGGYLNLAQPQQQQMAQQLLVAQQILARQPLTPEQVQQNMPMLQQMQQVLRQQEQQMMAQLTPEELAEVNRREQQQQQQHQHVPALHQPIVLPAHRPQVQLQQGLPHQQQQQASNPELTPRQRQWFNEALGQAEKRNSLRKEDQLWLAKRFNKYMPGRIMDDGDQFPDAIRTLADVGGVRSVAIGQMLRSRFAKAQDVRDMLNRPNSPPLLPAPENEEAAMEMRNAHWEAVRTKFPYANLPRWDQNPAPPTKAFKRGNEDNPRTIFMSREEEHKLIDDYMEKNPKFRTAVEGAFKNKHKSKERMEEDLGEGITALYHRCQVGLNSLSQKCFGLSNLNANTKKYIETEVQARGFPLYGSIHGKYNDLLPGQYDLAKKELHAYMEEKGLMQQAQQQPAGSAGLPAATDAAQHMPLATNQPSTSAARQGGKIWRPWEQKDPSGPSTSQQRSPPRLGAAGLPPTPNVPSPKGMKQGSRKRTHSFSRRLFPRRSSLSRSPPAKISRRSSNRG